MARSQLFELDAVFYAEALKDQNWEVRFPLDQLGEKLMAVLIDIYGNEARVLIGAEQFGRAEKNEPGNEQVEGKRMGRRKRKAKAG